MFHLLPSLGLTLISLTQTRVPDFSERALTLKVVAQGSIFSPRLDYAASSYVTAFPFASNIPNITARYLGLNLRVGYAVLFKKSWEVWVSGGAYYTTMFVTGDAFGYQNERALQIFPTVKKALGQKNVLSGYFKYAPIASPGSVANFSNYELAAGCSWTSELQKSHALLVAFDYSYVTIGFPDLSSTVQSTSTSLSLGYAF